MIAATNDLADTLHGVRDADSARAATDKMDRKFALMCSLMDKLPEMQRKYCECQDEGQHRRRS